MLHFVTGGARSGKSQFAEDLALTLKSAHDLPLYYLATATIYDDEMQQRVAQHKQRRDERWLLLEEPLLLSKTLTELPAQSIILIDCMTLWLSNWLCTDNFNDFSQAKTGQKQQFINLLQQKFAGNEAAHCIIVSNEVGSGIVPMGELSRDFVDHAGWLNQAIAKLSDEANLVVAGLPLKLK